MSQIGQKSVGLALVLECLVPGVGAMYAGSAGIGIGWLIGTSAWGLVAGVLLFTALGGGVHYVLLTFFEADHLPLVTFSLIITALSLGWLVVRLLVVNGMVGRYNQRLAAGIPARMPGQPGQVGRGGQPGDTKDLFIGGRAASSAALAIVLPVLIPLLQFTNILPFFTTLLEDYLLIAALIGVASLLPVAFLVTLFRLPQVPWWRALVETLTAIAVLQLLVLVGYYAAELLLNPGLPPAALLLVRYPVPVVTFVYVFPVLIATSLGFAVGLLFAPWRSVRERRRGVSSNGLLLAGVAISLGFVPQLAPYVATIMARHVAMFRVLLFDVAYVVVGSDVFVLLVAVSTILVASLMTRAQLIKVQVSLTHS